VRNRWGDSVTILEANRLRRGGVAGFFARERYEVVVDDGEAEDVAGQLCDRLLGLADEVSDDEFSTQLRGPESTEQLAENERAVRGVSTTQPDFAHVLESIVRHVEDTDANPASLAQVPVLAVPTTSAPGLDREALVRVGLPEELVRRLGFSLGADPSRGLLELLEHLPRPDRLPEGRGSVIAAVGDRAAALDLANQLAAELGLDADDVVLASATYRRRAVPAHRRIWDLERAEEQRRSWRRRLHPTIVAVESAPGRSPDWARRVLDALEPTMVWGAVEATRKAEDLLSWSDQLGGVDALSVDRVDETLSPATVLRCGIPVGRLDGRPATPALWAALLTPRLVV
jgi:hypothetical protein